MRIGGPAAVWVLAEGHLHGTESRAALQLQWSNVLMVALFHQLTVALATHCNITLSLPNFVVAKQQTISSTTHPNTNIHQTVEPALERVRACSPNSITAKAVALSLAVSKSSYSRIVLSSLPPRATFAV